MLAEKRRRVKPQISQMNTDFRRDGKSYPAGLSDPGVDPTQRAEASFNAESRQRPESSPQQHFLAPPQIRVICG
jgi:hypothetical protein